MDGSSTLNNFGTGWFHTTIGLNRAAKYALDQSRHREIPNQTAARCGKTYPSNKPRPSRIEPMSRTNSMECTGISAGWCPIHGDCTCRDPEDKNDDDCPLHSSSSTHGEQQFILTVWGNVPIGPNP